MSDDQPRDDGGQFTSAEPLTGLPGVEKDFGYSQMPAPETPGADMDEVPSRAEFDAIVAQDESAAVTPIVYHNLETGELADPKETVTLERAGQDLAAHESNVHDHTLSTLDAAYVAELDAQRAEVLKEAPEAAKELGLKAPEPVDEYSNIEGLEDATKAALRNPQIKAAVEEEFTKAAQLHSSYTQGLSNAEQMTRTAFMTEFPELSGLAPDQFAAGLAMLQEVDPPKFQKAVALMKNFQTVQVHQNHHNQYLQQQQNQQVLATAKSEDARLEGMIGKQAADEANKAVHTYLIDHGVSDPQQMFAVMKANPVLLTAEGRKTIADAARYKALMNAPKAIASRNIPTVQRPGVSAPRMSSGDQQLVALNRALDNAKSPGEQIKIARKILDIAG